MTGATADDRRPDPRALEGRHAAAAEEWLFTCWLPPGAAPGPLGVISGYRLLTGPARAWYWAALARPGAPLLHVTDWEVPPRSDPLLVKSPGLWAEHVCDAPMEQWTVANETHAVALDDPAEALARAYGTPAALAADLEWYATEPPTPVSDGYEQAGVVHGEIELGGRPALRVEEAPAHRWHRWGDRLGPVSLAPALAHTGVRAPFAFPDGTIADWVLTPRGWREKVPAGSI